MSHCRFQMVFFENFSLLDDFASAIKIIDKAEKILKNQYQYLKIRHVYTNIIFCELTEVHKSIKRENVCFIYLNLKSLSTIS